jgi:hypothetical protein
MGTRFAAAIVVAIGCGSGASGRVTATFETATDHAELDTGCVWSDRGDYFDIAASTAELGIEVTWSKDAITVPGTLQAGTLDQVGFSVAYAGQVYGAAGAVTFDTYDPTGTGATGSLGWSVDLRDLTVTGDFDCAP